MAKLAIKKASTDVTTYVFIQDSSKTTGAGLTGLAYNTADLVASYVRPGAARAALTLATQTVTGAHSDGGFVEVDATNMPGVYRLDLPDAVCATGVNSVVVMLKGAANMAPVLLEIQLVSYDPNSATDLGLSSVSSILADTGTDGVKVASLANDSITAAALKADAVTEIQSGLALEATLTAIKGAGWSNQTLVKIVTDIAAISAGSGATAEEVWEYVSRTLTQTATSITSSVSGSTITDVRGDSWDIDITDLTLDSNKQQFAIKRHAGDADSAALLLVDSDTGLLYINGAAGTAGDASLSYAGTTLTLTVKPAATAQLPSGNHVYGIQSVTAAGVVNEAYGGTFTVQADVVKATS